MGGWLGPVDDVAADAADGTIETVQDAAGAGSDIIGGSASFLAGGTADYLDDVGDAAGGAVGDQSEEVGSALSAVIDAAGDTATGAGEFAGDAATGATETAAENIGILGGGFGDALNKGYSNFLGFETLVIVGLGLAAVYLVLNSEATTEAAASAGDIGPAAVA